MDTTSFITHPGKVCRVMRLLTTNQRKVRNILEVRSSSPFLSTTVFSGYSSADMIFKRSRTPGSQNGLDTREAQILGSRWFESNYPDPAIFLKRFSKENGTTLPYSIINIKSAFKVGGFAKRVHPFPFRTRKLSFSASMVLLWGESRSPPTLSADFCL